MRTLLNTAVAILLLSILACQPASQENPEVDVPEANPAAPGFNTSESDSEAIAIADSIMKAMGGRKAWDNTNIIQWTFAGRRTLTWDKRSNDVRIDIPAEEGRTTFIVNLDSDQGKVFLNGQQTTQPDSVAKYLQQAKRIWFNDSYWLVMPYKLKDDGVTLEYLGQDTMQGGQQVEVLQLRFQQVGATPQNRYKVYVDPQDMLIKKWDYYQTAQDTVPTMTTPWADYKQYGNIMLSADHGPLQITDIKVMEKAPEDTFSFY